MRKPRTETCKLSPQQARLVRLELGRSPTSRRSACVFEIEGPVDRERLRASVARLADIHEVLRARLVQDDALDGAVLSLEPAASVGWTELRWDDLPEPDQSTPRLLLCDEPVGTSVGPGIEATWVKRSGGAGAWLILSAPSLLLDSVSFEVLLPDLCRLYDGFAEGSSPRAPRFFDLVEWQEELLTDPEFHEEHRHWRAVASGLTTLRPAAEFFSWRTVEVALPSALALSRGDDFRGFRATSTRLLALWLFLANLHHEASGGEAAICFDGRNYEGLDQVAGPLCRFLPLREMVSASESLEAVAERLVARLDDHENLQEYFDPRLLGTGSKEAFLDWMFECHRNPEPMQIGAGSIRIAARSSDAEPFGMRLSIVAGGDGQLTSWLDYDGSRFTGAAAKGIAGQFETLVCQAEEEGCRLGDLNPLADWMRPHILTLSRGEDSSPAPSLLPTVIADHAALSPQATAIEQEGTLLSAIELERRSNRCANALRRRGIGADDRVGVCLDRSPASVIAMLAILKAGGAYVPIDPTDPPARKASILRTGQIRCVLSSEHAARTSHGSGVDWIPVEALDAEADSELPPETLIHPDQLAYVLFTSGTTGAPKGVMVSHRGLANYVAWSARAYGIARSGTAIAHTPLSCDLTVTSLWTPLACGKRVILTRDRPGIEGLLEALPDEGDIGFLKLTPTHLRALAQRGNIPALAQRCRTIVIGGEALFRRDLEPWLAANPDLSAINEYGPTETVVGCCTHAVESGEDASDRIAIGSPTAGSQVYILDRELRLLPLGVVGEVYIGGVGVARGYIGEPGLTAERFVPHPFAGKPGERLYRTGDLARRRHDGSLEFLGRTDEQIKVRGFRVELAEIERALAQHPGVRECAVSWQQSEEPAQIVAYVAAAQPVPPTDHELRGFLRQTLPRYMVPTAYCLIDAVPLGPSGKVDRRRLPVVAEAQRLHAEHHLPPHTFLEQVLVAIWRRVLKVEQVGAEDSYFALGGDSILAIRIVAEAREKGLDLTIDTLFAFPRIRELAKQLSCSGALDKASIDAAPFQLVSEDDRERLPASVVDAYPLSALQAGMLYAMDYFSQSAIYHDVASYHLDLREPVDLSILQSAVDALVAGHPALRTSFDLTTCSEPLQLVWEACALMISVDDVSDLTAAAREERIAQWIEAEKNRPFVHTEPPLMRMQVHVRSASEIQLSLGFHHAILDGWSEATLLTELFERYFALSRGDEFARPAPAAGLIAEFLLQERAASNSKECRAYYRALLEGAPDLVVPRSSAEASGFHAKRAAVTVGVPISGSTGSALSRLADELAVPVKSVLLAAHVRVLAYLGGEKDVLTTMVSSGRPERSGGTAVLGLFLNSVPVRVNVDAPTWKQLVRACFEAERASIPCRRFPFAELRRMMSGREPPDTLFYFTHYHVFQSPAVRDEMRVLNDVYYEETTFGFVANFWLDPFDRSIHLNVTCDASRFAAEDVSEFAAAYGKAIEAMAAAPDGAPRDAAMLPVEQRQRLLVDWQGRIENNLARGPLLHALVERQARLSPHADAVRFRDRLLSYQELDQAAGRLAARLRRLAVHQGSIVGVMMCRSEAMIVALLGCLKAGVAYLPLEPDMPRLRLAWIIEEAQLATVLVDQVSEEPLPFSCRAVPVRSGSDDATEQASACASDATLPLDAPAYVIYTSGTTGRPKGVMISHRAIVNRLLWMQREYGLGPDDRVLQKTPFTFDVSLWDIFWPLTVGATVIVAEPGRHADADYLARTIEEWGVTTVHFVPSMLRSFVSLLGPGRCRSLKRLIASGEALDRDLHDRFFERLSKAELHNLYGPTEAAVDVTAWRCRAAERPGPVPIGKPISNLRVYILDPWLRLCPVGTSGEIYIAGIGLALGYVNRPGLTAERFVPDCIAGVPGERMYRTGDRGRWSVEGCIDFVGRVDEQIKLRGYRIEPGEIEAHLCRNPSVREAAVVPIERNGAPQLVAFVVSNTGYAPDPDELRQFLSASLPFYMIPSAFEFRPSLPRTASGKLNRRALSLSEVDTARPAQSPSAFGSPLEEVLSALWSEVLGVETVAPTESFFDLGGDSIAATRIVALVRERLDLSLELRRLFEMPTIRQFAQFIEGRRGEFSVGPARIERSELGDTAPLSFAQQRLWFLNELDARTASFVLPGAVLLEGLVDPVALEQALIGVAERHETLRTGFPVGSEGPVQRVHPASTMSLSVVDLRHLGDVQAHERAAAIAKEDAQRPFDLSIPPVRASLVRIGDASHLLIVTLHHIVADGWALAVLASELEALYRSILLAHPPELPALPIRYRDYAAWERTTRQCRSTDADLDFWRRQLRPPLPVPQLPTLRPVHAPSALSRTVHFALEGAVVDGLREVARRNGCTLFITLLAGIKALLRILTGSDDVVTLSDFANRHQAGTHDLIGFFTNQVVLRDDLSGDPSLSAMLRRVRDNCFNAYAHAHVPFEQLVGLIARDRETADRWLTATPKFVLQDQRQPRWALEGLSVRPIDIDREAAKLDLLINIADRGEVLEGWWEYREDRFDRASAENMCRLFCRALAFIAESGGEADFADLRESVLNESGRLQSQAVDDVGAAARSVVSAAMRRPVQAARQTGAEALD